MKKIKYWTEKEIHFLKKNYSEKSISYLSSKLHRTTAAVRSKAYKLGLKKGVSLKTNARKTVRSKKKVIKTRRRHSKGKRKTFIKGKKKKEKETDDPGSRFRKKR